MNTFYRCFMLSSIPTAMLIRPLLLLSYHEYLAASIPILNILLLLSHPKNPDASIPGLNTLLPLSYPEYPAASILS
jgi:hypothetical protein